MGGIKDWFTSPRERKGQELYGQGMGEFDNLLNEIGSLKSVWDVPAKMDMMDKRVQRMYRPARSRLSTQQGRNRSAAAERMGGNDAMPGMTFGNIDSAYAGAFSDLEGNAMDTLQKLLGEQDQFGMQKIGMKSQGLNAKQNAIANYLSSLSEDSTFDDILGFADTAANVYSGFKWPKYTAVGGPKG